MPLRFISSLKGGLTATQMDTDKFLAANAEGRRRNVAFLLRLLREKQARESNWSFIRSSKLPATERNGVSQRARRRRRERKALRTLRILCVLCDTPLFFFRKRCPMMSIFCNQCFCIFRAPGTWSIIREINRRSCLPGIQNRLNDSPRGFHLVGSHE